MKTTLHSVRNIILVVSVLTTAANLHAQGTAFTYQGRLTDNGTPANGLYDFRCQLYDAPQPPDALVSITLTNAAVPVSNGLFVLNLDFGASVFNGAERWLLITMRTNNALNFQAILPRQRLAPAPYAIFAGTAASVTNGAIGTAQLALNSVSTPQLVDGSVNSAKIADGSIIPADLDPTAFNLSLWKVTGNTGTTAGTHFLGTTDDEPLDLRVNNQRALQLSPARSNNTVNVLGGSSLNIIDSGVMAATISGGGTPNWFGGPRLNHIASDFATVGGGADNRVGTNSLSGVIGGGFANRIGHNALDATIGGGTLNLIGSNAHNTVIAGGNGNTASNANITISGGGLNLAIGLTATISGGFQNSALETDTVVSGGYSNVASGYRSTIAGGAHNLASAPSTVISGGQLNIASGLTATIGGGFQNGALNADATVSGGYTNIARGYRSTIAGGALNVAFADFSTISGGEGNVVEVQADGGTIAGGNNHRIGFQSLRSAIGGGWGNAVQSNNWYSVVAGGFNNVIDVDADTAVIGGGHDNRIRFNAEGSIIAGGAQNVIQTNAQGASIGGGFGNSVGTNAFNTKIGGGNQNSIGDLARESVIGGGFQNAIQTNAQYATVGGGSDNTVQSGAVHATIGGGNGNTVAGQYATISGGRLNNASIGSHLAIGGGYQNQAFGSYSTVPGGWLNVAGAPQTFAAGTRAKAFDAGSFVWADSSSFDFSSAGVNSFAARCTGGAIFVSAIDAAGNATAGVRLSAGGGSWVNLSDRNAKENFVPVNAGQVLEKVVAMPVTSWNYKSQDASVRHIGPTAQDFRAAFGIGESETGIATVDADGVALAAIQGLNQKLEEKEARIRELEKTVGELNNLSADSLGNKRSEQQ